MRRRLSEVRELFSVEEREECLLELASHCGHPQDIISYRDHENGVDVFLVEFDSFDEACRAKMLLGFGQIPDTNLASMIIPTNRMH